MKRGIFLIFLLLNQYVFSDELYDDDYNDFGSSEGITIYGDRDKYERENKIVEALNQGQEERKKFIEDELLTESGFRKTANVQFRKTTGEEKVTSFFSGIFHGISDQVPTKSFREEEYDKLPKGEVYNFWAVIIKNILVNVSEEFLTMLELEYMLEIEFSNGILMEKSNIKYYTEEHIEYFEKRILSLPDTPEYIKTIKERFLNIELPKIKSALKRHENPSESYMQARENLSDILKSNN